MTGITRRDEKNRCIICQAPWCVCGGPTDTEGLDLDDAVDLGES